MFSFKKNKSKDRFLTEEQEQRVVKAVQLAEENTSGEIRIYVESTSPYLDALDRAKEVFFELGMKETAFKNAVLIYIAHHDRKLAIYGDENIHQFTGGQAYWEEILNLLKNDFSNQRYAEGIIKAVKAIGESLGQYFPYDQKGANNELPDDIVYGK